MYIRLTLCSFSRKHEYDIQFFLQQIITEKFNKIRLDYDADMQIGCFKKNNKKILK